MYLERYLVLIYSNRNTTSYGINSFCEKEHFVRFVELCVVQVRESVYVPGAKLLTGHAHVTFVSCRITQVRHSRYGPNHVEPTFRIDDLSEPLAENDIRRFSPIKAATNDQTTSLNYDPIVA